LTANNKKALFERRAFFMPLSAAQCHQNALCPNRLIGYHCRRTIEKVEIKKTWKTV